MTVDFYWSLDGDLGLAKDGDIRDTSYDALRSEWQEIRTRSRSDHYDWALHQWLGANISNLLGKMNNRMTAEEGKTNLIAALAQGGFLRKEAIKIRYVPLGRHWLMYIIDVAIYVADTGQTRMLRTQLLYDTEEGDISVM